MQTFRAYNQWDKQWARGGITKQPTKATVLKCVGKK